MSWVVRSPLPISSFSKRYALQMSYRCTVESAATQPQLDRWRILAWWEVEAVARQTTFCCQPLLRRGCNIFEKVRMHGCCLGTKKVVRNSVKVTIPNVRGKQRRRPLLWESTFQVSGGKERLSCAEIIGHLLWCDLNYFPVQKRVHSCVSPNIK